MEDKISIYGLINPIDGTLFYIGQTNSTKRRINEHIRCYRSKNPYKDGLIKKIKNKGLLPELVIIDNASNIETANELEINYIARARMFGHKLTNLTDGGGTTANSQKITIFQYNEKGDFIKEFDSITEASDYCGISIGKLSVAIDQKINQSSGNCFWFTTKELASNFTFYKTPRKNCKIIGYNLDGSIYKIFNSQTHAEKETGIHSKLINKALRDGNGYSKTNNLQWKYYDDNYSNKINPWVNNMFKSVGQYTKDTIFVKNWNSIKEAGENLKINNTSIGANCRGEIPSAGGYQWCYAGEDEKIVNKIKLKYLGRIKQYSKEGELIKIWNNKTEASKYLKINVGSIGLCCNNKLKSAGGFIWKNEK